MQSPHRIVHTVALALALGLGSCTHTPPLVESTLEHEANAAVFARAPEQAAFTLGSGDTLHVHLAGQPDFSAPGVPLRIDPEGKVALPYAGDVPVAGLSVADARALIQERLSEFYVDPALGLTVAEYAAREVHVLGEVQKPGGYVLDRPLDALRALSLAGGVREGGDREHVALLRVEGPDLAVHFFDAATPGLDGMMPVQPGDLLFVRLSKGGAFKEQIVPILQAAAPIFGAITNLVVVSDALEN